MKNQTSKNKNNYDWTEAIEQLPQVQELRAAVLQFKALNQIFNNEETSKQLDEINKELDNIIHIAGKFYNLLGSKNWIMFDFLSVHKLERILDTDSSEEAENELIKYLKEPDILKCFINWLNKHEDMRPRIPLLLKAAKDFLEGRYYSSTLVVISSADGFINDFERDNRKGAHARDPKEFQTEDIISTIPIALPSFQNVFTKSIYKRIDEEVFDVYRNGIMHGMITNYDNPFIAGKAWCYLFALVDWAESKKNIKLSNSQNHDNVTISDLSSQIFEFLKNREEFERNFSNWVQHFVDLENPSNGDKSVIEGCQNFLNYWKERNYGFLGRFIPNFTNKTGGQLAQEAREIFGAHNITSYKIISIERTAPAKADLNVRITDENKTWRAKIPLVKYDEYNKPAADWENGTWKIIHYTIAPFKNDKIE